MMDTTKPSRAYIDQREASAKAAMTALEAELTPDQRALLTRAVMDTESAARADAVAEMDYLVDGIARHVPHLAPAIRAVGQHVLEREAEEGCQCHLSWAECTP